MPDLAGPLIATVAGSQVDYSLDIHITPRNSVLSVV